MAQASLFQWTVVPVPRPSPHLAEGPGGVVPALETGQGLQIWVGRLAGPKPIGQGGHPPLCRPAMEVGHVRRQAEAHALGQPVGAQEEGAALVQEQVEANAQLNRKVVLLDAAGQEAQSLLAQSNR